MVIRYEEALYQVYAPLPFTFTFIDMLHYYAEIISLHLTYMKLVNYTECDKCGQRVVKCDREQRSDRDVMTQGSSDEWRSRSCLYAGSNSGRERSSE